MIDVILIDRTLHMLARPARLAILKTIIDHANRNGWLLIADEGANIGDFDKVVSARLTNSTTELSRRGYLVG